MKNKKQLASLFVGRWQPFHKGHRALIETVLKKGKPVVIAIRDTEPDQNNIYTTAERWNMIQRAFKKYGELVKIVVIPDIDEICYGRDVGYAIRKIELEPELERVSGTKIRTELAPPKPIIWITGQSGSGKTTLAHAIYQKIGGVILDGDEMRQSISRELRFTKSDREKHNLRVARLARTLSKDNIVIVSVIAPFAATRKKIDDIAKPIWVWTERNVRVTKNRPYEKPKLYHIKVNTDRETALRGAEKVIRYLRKNKLI